MARARASWTRSDSSSLTRTRGSRRASWARVWRNLRSSSRGSKSAFRGADMNWLRDAGRTGELNSSIRAEASEDGKKQRDEQREAREGLPPGRASLGLFAGLLDAEGQMQQAGGVGVIDELAEQFLIALGQVVLDGLVNDL